MKTLEEKNRELLFEEVREDLKEMEKFIEDFSAFLPLSVCTVNPLGVVLDINRSFSDLTGYTRGKIVGEEVNLLFSEREEFETLKKKVLKEKLVKGEEMILISKAGEKIPVSVSASLREDEEGGLIGYFLALSDIRELKKREDELIKERVRKNREELSREYTLLQTLMNNSPDRIYFKDRKNRFVMVNKATAEFSGATPEQMIGKTDFDFFPQKEAKKYLADERWVMESGKPLINRIEKSTSLDGEKCWTSATKIPWYEKGKIIGVIGICRNITQERKEIERKLQEKGSLLQTLIDNIPDFVYFKDRKSRFVMVNKASTEDIGLSAGEMIGKTDFDLFSKEDAKKTFADDKRIMETGKPLINRIEKTKGRWMSTTKIPWYNKEGKVKGTMGISRDITETKELMRELEKTKIALRLKEAEERLARSEKLAAVGQLAAGVAHDLRSPLWAIKNAVYYLNKKLGKSKIAQENPKIAQFLKIADRQVNNSNTIISNLLGFTRIPKPNLKPTKINELIEDTLSLIEVPSRIKLNKDLDPQLPFIPIDKDQIRQVFSNIILNAVDAMPEGGGLRIKSRKKEDSVEVEFTDTGKGIPEEILKKIFEPLFTSKAKGTGLGLAICEQIIQAHKGEIKVKSKEGKGTTFTIVLSLRKEIQADSRESHKISGAAE